MNVSLDFTNERRLLSSVQALLREALAQLPLSDAAADSLARLAAGAVDHAITHAYPAGETGTIRLSLTEQGGRLEVRVRDFGLPQDTPAAEQALHTSKRHRQPLFGCDVEGVADELHWLGFGPEGKAFQIIKWLDDDHVAEATKQSDLAAFEDEPPLAPEQEYDVRRLQSEDAAQVSQLIYRAYGNTYFNEDVYYPRRVAAQNEHGTLVSFVAVTAEGEVVGHYALEFDQEGPVAEVGQAVVNPAHRQRGLMTRMKDAALAHAAEAKLTGWFADAVCVHPYTQKSNVEHGGKLCCVDLGISPATEKFRGFTEEGQQRISCMLYFHWLRQPEKRTVYVADRHRAIIEQIYQNLDCPVDFGKPQPPAEHGLLASEVEERAKLATLRITKLGSDSVHELLHIKRQLLEHGKAEAIFAELPLADPGAATVAERLEEAGFGILGIAPHFAANGDILRMAYHVEPLSREAIKVYEPFGEELLDYVLAEQQRVSALVE